MAFDALPIIVVSARTQAAADQFIAELIEEDVTAEVRPAEHASADRVWRLRNRYYTADVRVCARAAGDAQAAPARAAAVGAHVQLLDEAEAHTARLDQRLWLGDVRVVACRARALPERLQEQCAARMLEPVALLDEDEGVDAVRLALQAHVWPNLRRAGDPDPARSSLDLPDDEEEAIGVEAMERFAAALGAFGPAAAAVQGLQGAERRAAAEHLVAAFAAALDHDANL